MKIRAVTDTVNRSYLSIINSRKDYYQDYLWKEDLA